jgi:hypothetical protein
MKFNLTQRIQLAMALPNPQHGSVVTLLALRELQAKVFLKPDEVKKYGVKSEVNEKTNEVSTSWNKKGGEAIFDLKITPMEAGLIIAYWDKLSESDQFPSYLVDTYLEIKKLVPKNDNNNSTEKP